MSHWDVEVQLGDEITEVNIEKADKEFKVLLAQSIYIFNNTYPIEKRSTVY